MPVFAITALAISIALAISTALAIGTALAISRQLTRMPATDSKEEVCLIWWIV
jgi:hypothetical protein